MSVNSSMTAIADKIRSLLGLTGTMGLDAMSGHLAAAVGQSDAQADLIAQIKAALEGKAGGGGTVLPTLTSPGSASDLAQGKQLINAAGQVVEGAVPVIDLSANARATAWDLFDSDSTGLDAPHVSEYPGCVMTYAHMPEDMLLRQHTGMFVYTKKSLYGNAQPEDVARGKTFTSVSGVIVEGTADIGGGTVVKSGTTTSRTIDTGLSDIEQFFLYKESQTGTGLIRLHYTKEATSRMYASAWSTQNYGTKTITNGTGGVTVNGGSITISATQAAQGALTSGVTYKWIAVGSE